MATSSKLVLQELVELMKCDRCLNYLRPPISYCSDHTTICVLCESQTDTEILGKNEIVENIGSLLKFPCCYKEFGCKIQITWAEAKEHESECPFRQFECPGCPVLWRGKAADMKDHVNSNHSDLIFYSGGNFSLMHKKSLYFIITMEELYIFLYNCDTDAGLLWFALKSVGPLEHTKRRHFKLTLEMGDSDNYSERKQVESAVNWGIDENTAIKIDLCVLRMKLQLKYENMIRLYVNVFSRIPLYNGSIDEGLLRDVECPICQDYMNAPIYQCSIGHSVCSYCKPKLQSCPTCRGEMSESRNFALESVCSKMHYKCMYADDGCTFAALPRDITDHELNCKYGFFDCPLKTFISNCTWRGKLDQVSSHTLEEHGLKF